MLKEKRMDEELEATVEKLCKQKIRDSGIERKIR